MVDKTENQIEKALGAYFEVLPLDRVPRHRALKEIMKSDEYTYEGKLAISGVGYGEIPVREWAFKNADGAHLITILHASVGGITEKMAKLILSNPHLRSEHLIAPFLVSSARPKKQMYYNVRTTLLNGLEHEQFSHTFFSVMLDFVDNKSKRDYYNSEKDKAQFRLTLIEKARVFYELPASVPDSWVIKIITGKED
jgi:hypothetical protein